LGRRVDKGRHAAVGEASGALAARAATAGATAVDEDVTGADRAQGMELPHNLFGTAVHGATYIHGVRITGGPVRPAMDRAVRPRCQTQLTHAVLQAAFQRGLLLVPTVGDEEGARYPH